MSKRRRKKCQEIINEYWPGAPFAPAVESQRYSYDELTAVIKSAYDHGSDSISEVDDMLHRAVGYILSTNGFYPNYIDTCAGRIEAGLEDWGSREFSEKLYSARVQTSDQVHYMGKLETNMTEANVALGIISKAGCQADSPCGSGDSEEPCASCIAARALERMGR